MRNGHVRKLAVSAMFTAISTAICIIASFLPTLSVSLVAIAGIAASIVLIECGYKYSFLVYIASSVLVLLLAPDKEIAVIYAMMFGHYPMLQSIMNRIGSSFWRWFVKVITANIMLVLLWLVITYVLGISEYTGAGEFFVIAGLYNFAFVLYDICLKRLMRLYIIKAGNKRL